MGRGQPVPAQGLGLAKGRVAVAIDGETVRGAKVPGRVTPHLLSAATHQVPVVLAQRPIPDKTNEIPCVAILLDDLRAAGHNIARITFTLDALPTQHATATLLDDGGAGYVMTVKANQPKVLASIAEQRRAQEPQRTVARTAATAGPENGTCTSWTPPMSSSPTLRSCSASMQQARWPRCGGRSSVR